MNPVVHFELPYTDGNRMALFYESVFNWKTQPLGPQSNHYILATTTETDAKPGFPAGAINGGFYPVKPDWPQQYPSIVIGVGNLEETMEKINAQGGKVLGKPHNIPNFGQYVSFLDTEGNRNSIIQPTNQ